MKTFVYIDGFNLYYALKRSQSGRWLNIKALAEQALPPTSTVACVKYYTARVSGATDPGQPLRQQVYLNALATVPEIEFYYGTFLAKAQWRPIINLPIGGRAITNPADPAFNSVLPCGDYSFAVDPAVPRSVVESLHIGKYGEKQPKNPAAANDAAKALVFAMEEKGSDVNLAVHLVHDAWSKKYDAAAVISNDTDLVEPIRIVAQELKLPVYILTPPSKFGTSGPLKAVATGVRHISKAHLKASLFPDNIALPDGSSIVKPATW